MYCVRDRVLGHMELLRGDSKRSLDLGEFPLSGLWYLGLQLFLLPGLCGWQFAVTHLPACYGLIVTVPHRFISLDT